MTEPAARRAGGTILGRSQPTKEVGPEEARVVEASFEGLAEEPVAEAAPAPARPGDEEPRRPAARSGDLGSRWWLVGCAVFALASLTFAVLGLQQRRDLQAERAQTNELRDVSGRLVAAFTSYDYQHLDQWKRSVLANTTGAFQGEFESAFSGLEPTYVAEHNRGTGTIEGVWVGSVDGGKATTVVLVQITVTSLTGTHSLAPYIQLSLVKVGGHWRVDGVQATFDTGASGGPAATAPVPATAAPPGPSTTVKP